MFLKDPHIATTIFLRFTDDLPNKNIEILVDIYADDTAVYGHHFPLGVGA